MTSNVFGGTLNPTLLLGTKGPLVLLLNWYYSLSTEATRLWPCVASVGVETWPAGT